MPVLSIDMGVGGMLWISPLIMAFGTEKQKKEYVRPTGEGDGLWCSGYSEPEAGSDFLSLKTQAIRDGDYYIVNAQKIGLLLLTLQIGVGWQSELNKRLKRVRGSVFSWWISKRLASR